MSFQGIKQNAKDEIPLMETKADQGNPTERREKKEKENKNKTQ